MNRSLVSYFTMETRKLQEQIKGSVKYGKKSTLAPTLHKPSSDLADLACYAGVKMNPKIFQILWDLLQMGVHPVALAKMLKAMCSQNREVTPRTECTERKPKEQAAKGPATRPKENVTSKTTKEKSKKPVPNTRPHSAISTQSANVNSGSTANLRKK
ncbi:mitotic-spindle organizing protein 2 [Octopus sinensis]|uniref:Mitotic-spindle organizing protein 2 n=1 Tax=Octopus sinensis TaxID=2607531 RepID=A0A6P7TCD1_9MOLL|nr:mitotic-spindle organizing protein 2 [Octopus sinensis]